MPVPKAKSVLLMFLTGGPCQLDTFDPKPDAPAEVRGPFGSIETKLVGVRFAELLPEMAARAIGLPSYDQWPTPNFPTRHTSLPPH